MKHLRLNINRCLLVSGLLILSSVVYASQADNNIIEKLENHWQLVINEKNEKTREKMILEHRKMMQEARSSMGIASHHGSHDSGHHDMLHTFEMHESMMDMME